MVPLSPARTTFNLPRTDVMCKTYRAQWLWYVQYYVVTCSNVYQRDLGVWVIWPSLQSQPANGNHIHADKGRDLAHGMLVLLFHIIMYYCILLHAWEFLLDFIAQGDVVALDIYMLVPAISLDRHRKEELQPTVPDVVWVQDKTSGCPISWFQTPSTFCSQTSLFLYFIS